MQYKTQLHNTKKGSLSMFASISKIKTMVDSLAAIGQPLSLNDHLNFIFNGLPFEYAPFVCSMLIGFHSYTITNVEALLLARESRLEISKTTKVALTNVASIGPKSNLGHGRGNQFLFK